MTGFLRPGRNTRSSERVSSAARASRSTRIFASPIDVDAVDLELAQHLDRDVELALAAVDDEQVGKVVLLARRAGSAGSSTSYIDAKSSVPSTVRMRKRR